MRRIRTGVPKMTGQTVPRRLMHAAALALVLLALYSMVGFFLVPHVLERKLPEYAQHSGIDLSIGDLAFNPFMLTLEGRDVQAALADDAAVLSVPSFAVDLKAASVPRRTWIVSEAIASGVHARLHLGAAMANASSPADQDAATAPNSLPSVILERLRIADARVELLDGAGANADRIVVAPIGLQAENVSTLSNEYGHVLLTATLPHDGALEAAGELALAPFAVRGSMEVKGLRLEDVAALALQGPQATVPPTGRLDAEFGFHFVRDAATAALALQRLTAVLADFAIRRPGDEPPMVAFSSMALAGGELDLTARSATLQSLRVRGARFALARGPDGRLDIERVWQAFVREHQPPKTEATPWQVRIASAAVSADAAHYVDRASNRSPAIPARFAIGPIEAQLAFVSTIGSDATHVAISGLELSMGDLAAHAAGVETPLASAQSLAVTQGALDTRLRSVQAKEIRLRKLSGSVTRHRTGSLRLGPSAVGAAKEEQRSPASHGGERGAGDPGGWSVRVGRLEADAHELRYLDQSFTAPLELVAAEARFSFGLALTPTRDSKVVLSDMEAGIFELRARSEGQREQVELTHVALNGGRLDSATKRFAANSLALKDGRIMLARNADGRMRIEGLALEPAGVKTAPPPPDASAASWHYDIGALRIAGLQMAFADRSFTPAIAYRLAVDATLSDLNDTSAAPMRLDATLAAARGGTMRLQGTLAQDLRQANAHIRARDLALAPLDPLVARFAYLRFASGAASADMRADYRAERTPLLVLEGDIGMDGVQLNDTGTNAQFAAWQSLAAQRVRLTLSPDQLDIADVRVTGPQATLIVAKDRTLNLRRVLKAEREVEAEQFDTRHQPSTAFPTRIGRVTFAQGAMQFADLSLVLPFSTRIDALDGVIVGLTTAPDGRAELHLDGRIQDYGSAKARGSFNAVNPTELTDISVSFDNVRIPPLSPYTATFAGRMIESGQLWLELDYRISEGRLSGENTIILKDVKLGERVKSPTATDLPLELALALLKDAEGRVRLEIPISGNVGDPEFDYGRVIRAAIGRTLQRIVTAPFRALAHLFGGRDTDLVRKVEFEPGSHDLAPAEKEQLALLAKALMERPALDLIVFGPYDAALDDRALREQAVRESVAAAIGRAPVAGRGDPVAFADPGTQKVLDALAAARLDSATRAQLSAAKDVHGQSYYARIFDALVAQTQLSDTALQLLAANRARAITRQLTQSGLHPERIVGSQIGAVAEGDRSAVVALLDLRPGAR